MRTFRIREKLKPSESVIVCKKNAFAELNGLKNAYVFTDENVLRLYEKKIYSVLPDAHVYAMPAGEEHKNAQTLLGLLGDMAGARLTRSSTLVAVGGGVVGDIGGLASALYMRGINCVQVPTTLLAQVDSSVGGKTAIDFGGYKNLVGAFNQPRRVLVDDGFLKTLPAREIRCGAGEIVKHAALDGNLFDKLAAQKEGLGDLKFLSSLVPENIAIKARIVQADPHEAGLRKCLNLGHTTGHAFELSGVALSHGECVLVGILFEAEIAKRLLSSDVAYLNKLQSLALQVLGGMPALPDIRAAAQLARLDKKNGNADLVTVTAPLAKGEYALVNMPYSEYEEELIAARRKLC